MRRSLGDSSPRVAAMTVWRTKLNSQRPDLHDQAKWDEAKAYARRAGVVGVGWGRPGVIRDRATPEEVYAAVREVKDWSRAGVQAIQMMVDQMKRGDLIWTRDSQGNYWLGRITGDYRYSATREANDWDLNNVRPCKWLNESFRDYEVPGGVVRQFTGPGQTLRRIKASPTQRMTELIYESARTGAPPRPADPEEVITDYLDATDVEDLVLMYLQAKGWLLMPSTRMNDTPLYEAAFKRKDGRVAVVSVKSGDRNYVPVERLVDETPDGAEVFVYSTGKAYSTDPLKARAREIKRRDLVRFMAKYPDLLPPRITRWLNPTA